MPFQPSFVLDGEICVQGTTRGGRTHSNPWSLTLIEIKYTSPTIGFLLIAHNGSKPSASSSSVLTLNWTVVVAGAWGLARSRLFTVLRPLSSRARVSRFLVSRPSVDGAQEMVILLIAANVINFSRRINARKKSSKAISMRNWRIYSTMQSLGFR